MRTFTRAREAIRTCSIFDVVRMRRLLIREGQMVLIRCKLSLKTCSILSKAKIFLVSSAYVFSKH